MDHTKMQAPRPTFAACNATLGMTHSVCPACRQLVPAKIVTDGQRVFFLKFCRQHGETEALISNCLDAYLSTQRYLKPASQPMDFYGDAALPCPDGCGFCTRHEQHLCLPLIEITAQCNLACPICLVAAGNDWHMGLDEYRNILDGLISAEGQVDILNLSGGEPLCHPELLVFLDEALARPKIIRVSISTNGLRFLDDPKLLRELKKRDIILALQFDGFRDAIYEKLRGKPLLAEKLKILDMLTGADITTSLTMTVAAGVNDDQFPPMLDLLFTHENIAGMMIQPLSFTGRAASFEAPAGRIAIPEIIAALGAAQHPCVHATDFLPLPCSHPLCFSLAFYLMLDDGSAVSLNHLADIDKLLDATANKVFYGLDESEHARLKELVYELWSGPAAQAPHSQAVIARLRMLLRELSANAHRDAAPFNPKAAFMLAERSVKSIFLHAFQDPDTFDLARARRCCNAYPQADGRLIPVCIHNVLSAQRWMKTKPEYKGGPE